MGELLAGGLLLAFGRRIFWLFTGAAGFIAGSRLAERAFPDVNWLGLAGGAALGLLGALLAVFVQRLAVLLGGLLAGGFLTISLFNLFTGGEGFAWLPFLVGGILGALLLRLLFHWTLIVLSCLAGAVLVAGYFAPAAAPYSMLLLAALFAGGMALQSGLLKAR